MRGCGNPGLERRSRIGRGLVRIGRGLVRVAGGRTTSITVRIRRIS